MGNLWPVIVMIALASNAQPFTPSELGFFRNLTPTAVDQFAVTLQGNSAALTLVGYDDHARVAYSVGSNPTNGSLSGLDSSTGAITYTPTNAYVGQDFFQFRVSDGRKSALGNAYIAVVSNVVSGTNCFAVAPGVGKVCYHTTNSGFTTCLVGTIAGGFTPPVCISIPGTICIETNGITNICVSASGCQGYPSSPSLITYSTNTEASCGWTPQNPMWSTNGNSWSFYVTNALGNSSLQALPMSWSFCNSGGYTNFHVSGVVSGSLSQFANNINIGLYFDHSCGITPKFTTNSSGSAVNFTNQPIAFDIPISPNTLYTNIVLVFSVYGTPLSGDNHFSGSLTNVLQ